MCIDCCAKLNQYFDFFETSSRAQLSLQILFDPKLVASNKKEVKKEPELEPERQLRLVQFELQSCPPKEKVEEGGGEEEDDDGEDDDDSDEDEEEEDDDDDDDDNNNDCDQPPECTAADEVC